MGRKRHGLNYWITRGLWERSQRWWALAATLSVASSAFALLTAQSTVTRLETVGTIEANARAAYDILVRPAGTRLPLEESRNLIQPDYLQAVDQGISVEQWHAIAALPGIEVAAPIALIGWVKPIVTVPVDVSSVSSTLSAPTLLRRDATWTYDGGASRVVAAPAFDYLTNNPLKLSIMNGPDKDQTWYEETLPDGTLQKHALAQARITVSGRESGYGVTCVQADCGYTYQPMNIPYPVPFLMVAVDPTAESQLSGLDSAVVAGSYLTNGPLAERTFFSNEFGEDQRQLIPVMVASEPTMDLSVTYTVSEVGKSAAQTVATEGTTAGVTSLPGRLVTQGTIKADSAYRSLVDNMATRDSNGQYFATSLLNVIRSSPVGWTEGDGGALVAKPAGDVIDAYGNQYAQSGGDVLESYVPPGGDDTAFHKLDGYASQQARLALLRVGTFDSAKLQTASLAKVPLGTFSYNLPTGGDAASRVTLGDQPWKPSTNIAGLVQSPPLMITTLDALPAFSSDLLWSHIGRGSMLERGVTPVSPRSPLSAVRVRVSGVTGVDATSRERVRLAAEKIAQATGLDVDITLGSSAANQTVQVAAGTHGRPAITVTSWWVKKGVAVQLIAAADRKSWLLNVSILAVSGVVVNNSALASARARRRQLATLRLMGWSRPALLAVEIVSLLVVSLVAGLLGALVSLAVAGLSGMPLSWQQSLVAVPAAMGVVLVAGLIPTVRGVSVPPLVAARAPGGTSWRGSTRRRVRGFPGQVFRSIGATPGRSALSMFAVAIAVAATAVLWAIQAAFNGEAVGTLLGDAVTLQVRGPDLIAAMGIIVLASFGMAHALGLEVRERAIEFATLQAVGWERRAVVSLLLGHALVMGIAGSLLGGGVALAFDHWVMGGITAASWATTAGAAGLGIASACLATVIPAATLRRRPAVALLAEE